MKMLKYLVYNVLQHIITLPCLKRYIFISEIETLCDYCKIKRRIYLRYKIQIV